MSEYAIRALDASTWTPSPASSRSTTGVGSAVGGARGSIREKAGPRAKKGAPGRSVSLARAKRTPPWSFNGDAAVAWCQYGSPEELPRIYHRKEWEAGLTGEPPAYRLTCIFVDRDYRRKGVAGAAVRGALDPIAKEGGGVVEGYPHDLQGEKIRSQFLYSGTRTLFEEVGFTYERPKGNKNCVMRTTVSPVRARRRARVG
jgi:GNAT superfamily N-acetyltransferase